MKQKKGSSAGKMVAVGAGLAALSAAGYFLFGPNGDKNRKKARGWMLKMKGEIVEKMEMAKEMSEPVYHQIVDTVATQYAKTGNATKEEVAELAKDLKKHWKLIAGQKAKKAKTVVKKAVKPAKKVAKKK